MQRRTALKQIGFLVGGAALLPSCFQKETATEATVALHKLSISGNQENVFAAMAEALIPKTDTPGARDVNAHQFMLHMIDDCYDADAQRKFMNGFAQAEKAIEDKTGKSFEDCSLEEQQAFLKELEDNKVTVEGENNLKDFYDPFKRLIVRGYTGSEYVMTNIYGYNMIPGRFTGVVEINANSDLKTILG